MTHDLIKLKNLVAALELGLINWFDYFEEVRKLALKTKQKGVSDVSAKKHP